MALSVASAIPEHYIRTFEKNWNHVIQQEQSKLRDKVIVREFEGKELLLTDLEEVSFTERTGRLTASTPEEVTAHKRKLTKRDFKCQIIFDRKDSELLGQLSVPQSETMEAMKMAWNRLVDEKIIGAASATVYGGTEATSYSTAITLPSTQQVAVDYVPAGGTPANSGLTPEKIIAARKIYKENDFMPAELDLYIALSPEDEEFLETYIKASGNDVWANRLAEYEKGGKLFGFNVVCTNRLTHNTSTDIETAVTWCKQKGIIVAPERMSIQVDTRPDLDHAIMISAYADYGFARRYEKGVVEIAADHSP